ncbi:MAG: hypothetical protein IIZ08_05690 [Clostridia bacterium]|nr:hypothetical protein [Clostridia bacterium]
MKTLKAIQTISKIGKILSTIAFICCMIGAISCAVGIGLVAVYGDKAISLSQNAVVTTGDKSANEYISQMSLPMLITIMAVAAAFCVAGAVVSKFAQNYFKHELEDGTPFTMRGANELMRLGIIHVAVNLGTSIICGAVVTILSNSIEGLDKLDFENSSIGLGIVFIIVSLICKLGAEMSEGKSQTASAVEAAPEAAPADTAE